MISFHELKERKLVQWALGYAAGAWVILQLGDILSDTYAWPPLVMRSLLLLLGVGFFATLVLAWYHGEKGQQKVTTTELAMLTALLVMAGALLALVAGEPSAAAERTVAGDAPGGDAAFPTVIQRPAVEQASVAVLPFDNMSGDPDQDFFSDGLTEELLNALARIPGLRVAARTSSFAFQGRDVATDSIARALNVAHLVEGSVRQAGDRVRISAQLIDAESGFREWGDTYDREITDIFAVQDEIGRAIADELRVRVAGHPLAERGTDDAEAYALVLRARQAIRQQSDHRQYLPDAERLFGAARERDGSYAAAWAGLADVHRLQAYVGTIPAEEGYERARAEAERALELNPSEAGAHFVLAFLAQYVDGDWAAAEESFERLLRLHPSDARSLAYYGWFLQSRGRQEEALRAGRRAVELDPLSTGVLNNVAAIHLYARDYAQSAELLRAAISLVPDDATLHSNLGNALVEMGRHDEAINAIEHALSLNPQHRFARATLAYANARAGRRAAAERALEDVPKDAYYHRAAARSALGEPDRAFELLERALEASEGQLADLAVDPWFEDLRGDPRMDRLLEELELEEAGSGG